LGRKNKIEVLNIQFIWEIIKNIKNY